MDHKALMVKLAQGQLDAYNNRDIETFCRFFHPEVEVFRIGSTDRICVGMEAFREIYRKRFNDNPRLHCELRSRTVLGFSVLDEEWVTGVEGAEVPSHVVAIYQIEDGLIKYVSFCR